MAPINIPTLEEIADVVRFTLREELEKSREADRKAAISSMQRLTVKQAAEDYGFPEHALRNRIQARTIPFRRDGGSVYFIRAEFESWVVNGSAALE
jgi:hypothetical protein